MSPMSTERSPRTQDAGDHPRAPQDDSANQEMPHNTPYNPNTPHLLQAAQYRSFWPSFTQQPFHLIRQHPQQVLLRPDRVSDIF